MTDYHKEFEDLKHRITELEKTNSVLKQLFEYDIYRYTSAQDLYRASRKEENVKNFPISSALSSASSEIINELKKRHPNLNEYHIRK